eukprot:4537067-Prymnesium_polylepis.2
MPCETPTPAVGGAWGVSACRADSLTHAHPPTHPHTYLRLRFSVHGHTPEDAQAYTLTTLGRRVVPRHRARPCLLYTSDAADDM